MVLDKKIYKPNNVICHGLFFSIDLELSEKMLMYEAATTNTDNVNKDRTITHMVLW